MMGGLVAAGPAGPAGAFPAAGLIHLDRVRPVRYQPAMTQRATWRSTPGSGSRRRRRCAIWILLLCLGALLSWTPAGTHSAAAVRYTVSPASPPPVSPSPLCPPPLVTASLRCMTAV